MDRFSTRVYIMDTGGLSSESAFNSLYKTVSKRRQDKIDAYRRQNDKVLSLAVELLLMVALRELGIEHYQIVYGEYEKPYLKGENVFFNLSHSGERAMCAVSMEEVGCDVEMRGKTDLKIADRFFHPSECAILDRFPSEYEKRTGFYRLWTLKESFIKAAGTGMQLLLDHFSIDLNGSTISVMQEVSKENYYFKEYALDDGYFYAVCGKSPDFENEVRMVTTEELADRERTKYPVSV